MATIKEVLDSMKEGEVREITDYSVSSWRSYASNHKFRFSINCNDGKATVKRIPIVHQRYSFDRCDDDGHRWMLVDKVHGRIGTIFDGPTAQKIVDALNTMEVGSV